MSRLFLYLQSIFNVVLGLCTVAISGGCSHLGEKNNFITYSKDLVVGGRTIKDSFCVVILGLKNVNLNNLSL